MLKKKKKNEAPETKYSIPKSIPIVTNLLGKDFSYASQVRMNKYKGRQDTHIKKKSIKKKMKYKRVQGS